MLPCLYGLCEYRKLLICEVFQKEIWEICTDTKTIIDVRSDDVFVIFEQVEHPPPPSVAVEESGKPNVLPYLLFSSFLFFFFLFFCHVFNQVFI